MKRSARRRIKATVSYDGTGYRGFQLQPNGPTIQSVMEEALTDLLQEPVRLRPAGRTDAGVHARGQVVDFSDSGRRSLDAVVRGGNALLPPEIRILSAVEVPPSFDAGRHAKSKEYRYFLYIAPVASPFFARYAWHLEKPVDLGAMTTVREIFRAGIEAETVPGLVSLVIAGSGFLRHMVRNVVGTLVDIGRGKTPPDRMRELLRLRDRTLAGPNAPPHGLFLWEVAYGIPEVPVPPGE